jgi:hypothetical protein
MWDILYINWFVMILSIWSSWAYVIYLVVCRIVPNLFSLLISRSQSMRCTCCTDQECLDRVNQRSLRYGVSNLFPLFGFVRFEVCLLYLLRMNLCLFLSCHVIIFVGYEAWWTRILRKQQIRAKKREKGR